MHSENQSIQSTSKKRTREDNEIEDVSQVDKKPKLDFNGGTSTSEKVI